MYFCPLSAPPHRLARFVWHGRLVTQPPYNYRVLCRNFRNCLVIRHFDRNGMKARRVDGRYRRSLPSRRPSGAKDWRAAYTPRAQCPNVSDQDCFRNRNPANLKRKRIATCIDVATPKQWWKKYSSIVPMPQYKSSCSEIQKRPIGAPRQKATRHFWAG